MSPFTRVAQRVRPAPTVSVRDGLAGHDNALGIIRLGLALAVIVSHGFPLGGWGEDPLLAWSHGQENLGGFAVLGFFAISGYLVTRSGMRGDVLTFLWHRCLRIFPALWVLLLVTVFVVAPVMWRVGGASWGSYWTTTPGPLTYLAHNAVLQAEDFGIGDLFRATTPYGQTVQLSVINGSLWTLQHEFYCYLVVAALVATTVLARPRVARIAVPALTAAFLVIRIGIQLDVNLGAYLPTLYEHNRTKLVLDFLFGACLAVYSQKVKFDDRIAAGAAVVLVVTAHYGWLWVFGLPALAYLVLWLAHRLPRSVRWVGARNDYSYGIYLYGFLVLQVLAALHVYRWGYVPFVGIAVVVSWGCAWLSWHGVERRALGVRNRGPGHGLAAAVAWVRRHRPARRLTPTP